MINLILQGIRAVGFDRVRLYSLSGDRKELVAMAQSGMDDSLVGAKWTLPDISAFHAFFEGTNPRLFKSASEGAGLIEIPINGGEAREWAGVPLIGQGEIKGLIAADNKLSSVPISEEMLSRLSLFAAQAVEAITVGEELEDIKVRATQMEALDRTTLAITSSLERRLLLRMIIQNAVQLLGGESGGIYEYCSQRGELTVVAEHNRPEHIGKILKVGEGMAGRLVSDEKGAREDWDKTAFRLEDGTIFRVIDNYNEWPGRAPIYADGRPFEAVVGVPLKWRDGIIGVLYVDALKGRHFMRHEAHLLKRFADHAAIAMVNADLATKNETKLKRLARLSDVMKELMRDLGTKGLDERLNQVAKYAAEILGAEVCGVFLVKEDPYALSLEASFGHREGAFQKGKRYAICCGVGTGLTGHIAAEGKLFNSSGDDLNQHPAVRGVEPDCSPSFVCTSLLAIPLKSETNGNEKLVGLIRASNKKDDKGRVLPPMHFGEEDEWILTIFAEAVVTAIEGAILVNELTEKKEKLLRMVASSPSGIIAADKDGHITEFNDQARYILGFMPNDPRPLRVADVYLGEADARRIGGELHRNDGRLERFKTEILAKYGTRIPILLSATWLHDANGERVGSVGYFEDLRPLLATEKRLELFLEANSIVATADSPSEGLQNLAEKLISLLNNSFCRILLLDESGQHLTVEAAYPITRSERALDWNPGRGERIALSEYEGLSQFLKMGESTEVKWSDEKSRPLMEKFSRRIGLKTPVQCLLVVPLRLGEEVVGLLDIGEVREEESPSTKSNGERSQICEQRSEPFSHTFTPEKVEMVTSVAAQTSFLIERIKLFEAAERRRLLLERLDEKVRELQRTKELEKIQMDVVIFALDLVKGRDTMAGALFANHKLPQVLEPVTSFQLDPSPVDSLSYEDGPIGKVAKTGKPEFVIDYSIYAEREGVFASSDFRSMVAVPLSQGSDVQYVLALADRSASLPFGDAELEALERFAAQAAIALQTAQLLNSEQRTFRHLNILHQITELVLSEHDLGRVVHAVLTGVTASYGLGFNRAVVLLLDEAGETLEGTEGIGQVDQKQAEKDWERDHANKLDNFQSYIEFLKHNPAPSTSLGDWVRQYRLSVADEKSGYFKLAVHDRKWSHIPQSRLNELPKDFLHGFRPKTDIIVIPLHTREKTVGVLVVDNKFTKSPISHEDVELLMTYGNTAALAIDNIRLIKRIDVGREKMQFLFKAGTSLRTTTDPNRVLADIVHLTHEASEAIWVHAILIDELGRPHDLISEGTEREPPQEELFLPGGVAERVMQSGEAVKVENTHREQHQVNYLSDHKHPQALLCLPLATQGRKFGVILIGYKSPRVFPEIFVNALQLYVNQAAIAYDSARRMEELEQMRHAAEALADAEDPQSVLDQIVKGARVALRADSTAIWTYDDVRDEFLADSWVSSNIAQERRDEFWKAQPRFGGTAHTVMRKGLLAVQDLEKESSYSYVGERTRSLLRSIGVRSFLGIALTVANEKLGVLYVNYKRPRNFSEEEEETAWTFANHAALALKKAKLIKYAQRAKKAAEAVAKVTVLGDHELTLNEIVKETKVALGCDAVVLFVFDRATNKLGYPPYMGEGVLDREAAMRDEEVDHDSIVYKILQREQAEFIEKAEEAPLVANRRFRIAEKIKSLVAIPLKARGEKVGVMFVNYRIPHHFTDEERDNIELFANQAAFAIHNAQLFEKQSNRLREKSDLLDLSKGLLRKVNLNETLQVAVDSAVKILQAEFCAIVLPEEEGDELIFSASHGWDEKLIKTLKLKSSHGSQTGYTIETRVPVIVEDFKTEQRFNVHPILKKLGIRSSMSVPMFEGDKAIGAILIHNRKPRYFGEEDLGVLSLIANQTAIAMQRARQFEEVNRTRRNVDALYEASKAITASFRPHPELVLSDHKLVLDEIIKQAVEGITGVTGPKATLGMIKLYDEAADELVFESVYPVEKRAELIERIGERRSISELTLKGKPIGVVGKAVKTGKPQLVPNVSKCPYYVEYDPSTRSELVVPLIIEGKVRGVINVESDKLEGFDKDDVTNLQALAELAVVVLKNAELFNELIETKGIADSSRALARMGMISSIWRHAIEGHTINIQGLLTLMRSDIRGWNLSVEQSAKLEERLRFIERISEKILRKEGVPLLSPEETIEVISVNDLIHDRVKDLWKTEPYCKADHSLNLADSRLRVRANPDWCRRALDILIDNAIEAMSGCELRKLTVSTRRVKSEIEISVSDTGHGVSPEKLERILKKPIPVDEGQKGFGVGLLLAKTIVETYNGRISLKESTGHGTTFVITLPAAV